MKKRIITTALAACMIFNNVPLVYAAEPIKEAVLTSNSTTNVARNTVDALGIMQVNNLNAHVTRGNFAQILVNASTYAGNTDWILKSSPYADVSSNHWASSYIQITAQNDWLTGYLGGRFKPEDPIKLHEAVYGLTSLLGYTRNDVQGSQLQGRMKLYYDKGLNDNISKGIDEALTREDCINLIYNTLKAANKNGIMYGQSAFNATLDPVSGEINYLNLLEDKMVGPFIVETGISSIIPFALKDAVVYIDRKPASTGEIRKGDIVYYNKAMKTVWVYRYKTETGRVLPENVQYANGGLIPTGVTFVGGQYVLEGSAVAAEFSTFGDALNAETPITIIYDERTTMTAEGYEITTKYIVGVVIGK
jgi:S-layer homology domain.